MLNVVGYHTKLPDIGKADKGVRQAVKDSLKILLLPGGHKPNAEKGLLDSLMILKWLPVRWNFTSAFVVITLSVKVIFKIT